MPSTILISLVSIGKICYIGASLASALRIDWSIWFLHNIVFQSRILWKLEVQTLDISYVPVNLLKHVEYLIRWGSDTLHGNNGTHSNTRALASVFLILLPFYEKCIADAKFAAFLSPSMWNNILTIHSKFSQFHIHLNPAIENNCY